jgi:two-component system, LuxR family, sensor histidine kinase DctS
MATSSRILLIEDDQVDRLACRRAFASRPGAFDFLEADTGAEGVHLARSEQPSCVLLDYRLPDMNGLEVLAQLGDGIGGGIDPPPVVMLTGANDVAVAVEAMRRGARDYLLKDAEHRYLELLVAVVERVLQERRLITDKQRAEVALVHAHRLITAGELAAALAHELNQPLTAITTFSAACAQQLNHTTIDRQKLRRNVEQIALQAQRAAQTIRELRAFLTKGEARRAPMDLNQLIRSTTELVEAEARARGVEITLDLADALPPVRAARVHIEHVLLNLVQNAMDAIQGGGARTGTITVATRGGEVARISVRDDGPGFDAETAARIFEPFYTTKADGLGMGLAISRSIIEAHEGALEAESLDGGAVFRFTLPFAA